MKLLARFKFSLWTLLWLAVLIGAGMGMYAKREPWRIAWETRVPDQIRGVRYITDAAVGNPFWFVGFKSYAQLDLNTGSIKAEEFSSQSEERILAINAYGTLLLEDGVEQETFKLLNRAGEKLELECHTNWPLQSAAFSPNGTHVVVSSEHSSHIFSATTGALELEWKVLWTSQPFYAEGARHSSQHHLMFHPTLDRVLVRTGEDRFEEWDLETRTLLHSWYDGNLEGAVSGETQNKVCDPVSPKVCTVEYLQNGNHLFRRWDGWRLTWVWCTDARGIELWRHESETGLHGDDGLFEAGLARKLVYLDYKLIDLVTGKDLGECPSIYLALPDCLRVVAPAHEQGITDWGIKEIRTGKFLCAVPGLIEAENSVESWLKVIDNQHILRYGRKLRHFTYFEQLRPEYWWGWFYVPETYIAALAVGCLFISLIRAFRTKKVSVRVV